MARAVLRRGAPVAAAARARRARRARAPRPSPPRCRGARDGGVAAGEGDGAPSGAPEAPEGDAAGAQGEACYAVGTEVECVPEPRAASSPASTSTSESSKPSESEGALASLVSAAILVSPFLFWGTSMVAMKGTLEHTTPYFVAFARLAPAGALVVAYALSQGRKIPEGAAAWGAVSLFALVDAAMFQGFLANGLTKTSAGLGSVIIDSQPLTVAVLASVLYGEELGAIGVLGLLVGVSGLLLLEVPAEALGEAVSGGGLAALLPRQEALGAGLDDLMGGGLLESGEFNMLLAAQSMAVGTVMVRWVGKFADPVMATGWHMLLGSLPMLYLALTGEQGGWDAAVAGLTPGDLAALAYVAVFGGAVGYGVFFWEANRGNLTRLSSLTFLTPMFAAGFGYSVLGETLTTSQLAGAAVTLAAVVLVNSGSDGAAD